MKSSIANYSLTRFVYMSQNSFHDGIFYFNCFTACLYQTSHPFFLSWQTLSVAIQIVLPWTWLYKSQCNCGKFTGQWNGINNRFDVVALVGRKHVYNYFYFYTILSELYEGLYLLKSSQRFWKCQRNRLNRVCVPYIDQCPMPLIALSNIHSNPLLTCSSWKIKNHFSDCLGDRTWFSFYCTLVGMFRN